MRKHLNRWVFYWAPGFLGLVIVTVVFGLFNPFKAEKRKIEDNFSSKSYIPTRAGKSLFVSGGAGRVYDKSFLPFGEIKSLNIRLYLPAPYEDVTGVAFHEAGNSKALSQEPIGHLIRNDNPYKTDVPLDSGEVLPNYFIMESRGEYSAATTVADVAIREGTPVRSPIDGVITKVKHVVIYGGYDDLQVEIMPAGHPDLRVAFLHLDQLRIKEGDSVKQSKTVLGVARDFRSSFRSEIEDYVKPAVPHVHIQLNRFIPEPE